MYDSACIWLTGLGARLLFILARMCCRCSSPLHASPFSQVGFYAVWLRCVRAFLWACLLGLPDVGGLVGLA